MADISLSEGGARPSTKERAPSGPCFSARQNSIFGSFKNKEGTVDRRRRALQVPGDIGRLVHGEIDATTNAELV